jgi:integrase
LTKLPLKYIDRFTDRHGRVRCYFRRPGGPRIALPDPNDPGFIAAYHAALNGGAPQPIAISPGRTFDNLALEYFRSAKYLGLAKSTRYARRKAIDRIIRDEKIGSRPVAGIRREHVMKMVAKRHETPGAANECLKMIRRLIRFSILLEWRTDDPTLLVEGYEEGEWHSWNDAEIEAYQARWPVGSAARTAFALLLYTGQRLSDVSQMTWASVGQGRVVVVQEKTKAQLSIPIHPELARALAAHEQAHLMILTTQFGRPFSRKGFGNWMAKRIAEAGLPDECVTHGIRKAAARRLAEAGCTEKEIASITGHTTLKEVARYTKAASQSKLADRAMARLEEQQPNGNSQTLVQFPKPERKAE